MTTSKTNGETRRSEKTGTGKRSGIGHKQKEGDPLYGIPLLGDLVARADTLRTVLPLGRTFTRTEADVLRKEARALRLAANLLDRRAAQLERVGRRTPEGERPRIEKITID